MAQRRLSPQRQALQDLLKLLRATRGFLGYLTAQERKTFEKPVVAAIAARFKQGIDLTMPGDEADLEARIGTLIAEVTDACKAKRERKPANEARDKEIVRLHDVDKKSFGEVPRLLVAKNPGWSKPNGKPLEKDAVRNAYRRLKSRKGTS